MKTTLKSVAAALAILAVVVALLTLIDGGLVKSVSSASKTYIKVTAVDLDGSPVHNAQVTVQGGTFNTDNKGLSPAMELSGLTNCYDDAIAEWKTVTVVVKRDGYVPALVFNCVVYVGQTRKLTVKLYPVDGSELPYVSYVESPPDEYIRARISVAILRSAPCALGSRTV